MAGLPQDFLQIVKPVRIVTALNTTSDSEIGASEAVNDKFFLASLQQEYIAPQAANVEGTAWAYWVERLGGVQHAQGTVRTEHIRYAYDNHTSAQNCRLRSAGRGYAHNAWGVYSSGNANGYNATTAFRAVPACVIY